MNYKITFMLAAIAATAFVAIGSTTLLPAFAQQVNGDNGNGNGNGNGDDDEAVTITGTCADRGGTCQGNNAGNNFGSQEFRDFNLGAADDDNGNGNGNGNNND